MGRVCEGLTPVRTLIWAYVHQKGTEVGPSIAQKGAGGGRLRNASRLQY